jgi:hypothetical protein
MVSLWLTVLEGERRKAALGSAENESDFVGGLLDASRASGSEQIPVTSSFLDSLFQPLDDSIFMEPTFLPDMLLLDSSTGMGECVDPLPAECKRTCSTPSTSLTLLRSPPRPRPPPANPSRTIPTTSIPSPYRNHLTVHKLSFHAARIQNALHLGLPEFLAQKEDDISPWYWHTQFTLLTSPAPLTDLSSLAVPATRSYEFAVNRPVRRQPCFIMSETVISDLSPTPLQRSQAHGMYLDVVPFPVFRDRTITLLSMDPPAFDEKELKRDMEDGGLMVWGVGHGSTRNAASLVRDRRNWECAGWFYKKWRLLVDGSGMEEQSRWWRVMRGEEDSDEE